MSTSRRRGQGASAGDDGSRREPDEPPVQDRSLAKPGAAEGAIAEDPWTPLRRFTPARIALGRAGVNLPTREVLSFGLAHARARDAVHAPLDVPALRARLLADGWAEPLLEVQGRAGDRATYLARPDLGRQLDDRSLSALDALPQAETDLVFVVSDGLSSKAVSEHGAAFLAAARDALGGLRIGPVVIATQARVALADAVGQALHARIAVSVIGERPGLSSPDSLGLYVTWDPKPGRSDAERNCISNIHGAGLSYAEAARQLAALVRGALEAKGTGVKLEAVRRKAVSGDAPVAASAAPTRDGSAPTPAASKPA